MSPNFEAVGAKLHESDSGSDGVNSQIVTVNLHVSYAHWGDARTNATFYLAPQGEALNEDSGERLTEIRVVPLSTSRIQPGLSVAV
jgi:hypothetical protein